MKKQRHSESKNTSLKNNKKINGKIQTRNKRNLKVSINVSAASYLHHGDIFYHYRKTERKIAAYLINL